eukprot:CAMPEP_0170080140 /NCGR_PEP_ID=MMETSP0019_2-20121128/16355_1 /TAXON_ID=98059 /ORGANISM="Dinobryon sp., Strain UTEXLB2267" /LENGTH=480 /DNA_ID=CAMNT_0010293967 /DNA_START=16 /DNA_END=1458 /DNA_ORIENTATION=+
MTTDEFLTNMQGILPELLAFIVALALTSVVMLLSAPFAGNFKIVFQTVVFGAALAGSISYLVLTNPNELSAFWSNFIKLNMETRFCLAIIAISCTYFGGAMYLAPPEAFISSSDASTPASCDTSIEFDVPTTVPEDDKELFELMFERLRKMIIDDLPTVYEMPEEAVHWIDRMIDYTVAGGKMNRGLAMMSAYSTLMSEKGRKLTPKDRCQSAALGWCIEFLQAFFLVADDVMDNSITRRGQPCWYRNADVKLISINDSFILESCVFKILKRYFGAEKYYTQLVDLFIEVTRQTELGQLLDLTSQPHEGPIDLNRFTLDRYISIVKYKTAFYSFYLPVALGMIMSGVTNPLHYQLARKILVSMGEYFQIQDDYLDCYGAPEVIGKIGTDIQDKKCSWLVVQALRKANPQQRRILEENYGVDNASKVAAVKRLYAEMHLEELFKQYEEDSYAQLQQLMSEAKDMPRGVFEFLLKKIYKRSK